MKKFKKHIIALLALLLTAVTGAWAKDVTENINLTTATVNGKNVTVSANQFSAYTGAGLNWNNGRLTVSTKDGSNIIQVVLNIKSGADKARDVTSSIGTCTVDGSKITATGINASSVTFSNTKTALRIGSVEVTYVGPDPGTMVLSDAKTEATMEMPGYDVTIDYEIVRDMQDEANPVIFSGLPTNDEPIVVKKGDDGKYQPAEALTIQLIDPLAAAEAQNIIAADGITVKVLVGDDSSLPIEYDHYSPITLEAFLADMKPGYYWIKAEPTDENSPYDGTVYSSQFTVVEKYDLTVKPANDFSKGKVESVTVGSGSVTIDANTGEATKTGIDPDTEVKIKAKRGYVIDKVEVKKAGPALKTLTVNAKQLNYVEGDTWQQAIERPENAGSAWSVQGNYITNVGLTLFTNGGGATYVYVKPGDTIDATKNYSLEAD